MHQFLSRTVYKRQGWPRLWQELDEYWPHSYDPLIPPFSTSMYYKDIISLGFPYSIWWENHQRCISFWLEQCIKDKDSQGYGKNRTDIGHTAMIDSFSSMYDKDVISLGFLYSTCLENHRCISFGLERCIKVKDSLVMTRTRGMLATQLWSIDSIL